MVDREKLEIFKSYLRDKYTAAELCEKLGLTEDDILEQFEHLVVELDQDDE